PGGFLRGTDTDELAKVRSEEQAARRQGSWAMTRWPDVAPGRRFSLQGVPAAGADGDYLIGECAFVAIHPGHEGLGASDASMAGQGDLLLDLLREGSSLWRDTLQGLVRSAQTLAQPARGQCAFLIT